MVKLTDKQLDMGNLAKFNSRHVAGRAAPAGRPGLGGRRARRRLRAPDWASP